MNAAEEAAFLIASYDDPGDDAPRLVFADWLDENGESERAEFIRLGCALAALQGSDRRRDARDGRLLQLFDQYAGTWFKGLKCSASDIRCVRGLPDFRGGGPRSEAEFSLDRGRSQISWKRRRRSRSVDALFVPRARLTKRWVREDEIRALAACPYLLGATALTLGSNYPLTDTGAQALAASPYLKRLTRLELSRARFTARQLAALLASPHLERLTTLSLVGGEIFDMWPVAELPVLDLEAVQVIAHAPLGARLRSLNLSNNGLGDQAAELLISSPHLPWALELSIYSNDRGALSESARGRLRARFASVEA
jgi:uncharacterized protein (TIGR02996 family)